MQLDDVCPVDLAEVRARTPFVNSQQRLQLCKTVAVDQQTVLRQPADLRPPARNVDLIGVPCAKQYLIGLLVCLAEAAKEFADVELEVAW